MCQVRELLINQSPSTDQDTFRFTAYETALECIKVLSRSPAGTSHLTTAIAIRTLIHHAQYSAAVSTDITKGQQHAVSALCNTLLLHQNAPSLCVKEGLGDWALSQLAGDVDNGQDQTWPFLMGRIIMVLTSRATYGFLERLVDELNGLSVFKAVRHSRAVQDCADRVSFSQ
jgi:hypothetical protein